MKIRWTSHAYERARQRGVSYERVEAIVNRAAKYLSDGLQRIATKRQAVVVEIKAGVAWIITVIRTRGEEV